MAYLIIVNLSIFNFRMVINKDFKIFFVRLLIFCGILFLIDRGLGLIFERLNKNQKAGKYTASNIAFINAGEDVIIFGPSTARNNYNVPKMATVLNMSVRSVAEPAMCPMFHDVQLHFILHRHLPKLVIMDIRSQELIGKGYEQPALISLLLPYYNQETKDYFSVLNNSKDFKEDVFESKLSLLYKYNSQLLYLFQSNYFPDKKDIAMIKNRGFDPLPAVAGNQYQKLQFIDYGFTNTPREQLVYNSIYDFIQSAQKCGVKVIIIIPPKFYKTNDQTLLNQFKNLISLKYGHILYDFSSDTTFSNHPGFFANRLHLNNIGADIYTNRILKIVKETLK